MEKEEGWKKESRSVNEKKRKERRKRKRKKKRREWGIRNIYIDPRIR